MRKVLHAGDKLLIDYCGPTLSVVNPNTGEIRSAQVFVATLGGQLLYLCRSDFDAKLAGLAVFE